MSAQPRTAPSTSRGTSRLLAAGIAGNLLEWFDFAIYGFFAVTIGNSPLRAM